MTALRAATERHRHTESLVERDRQRRKRWRNAGLVSMEELSNLLKPEKAPLDWLVSQNYIWPQNIKYCKWKKKKKKKKHSQNRGFVYPSRMCVLCNVRVFFPQDKILETQSGYRKQSTNNCLWDTRGARTLLRPHDTWTTNHVSKLLLTRTSIRVNETFLLTTLQVNSAVLTHRCAPSWRCSMPRLDLPFLSPVC